MHFRRVPEFLTVGKTSVWLMNNNSNDGKIHLTENLTKIWLEMEWLYCTFPHHYCLTFHNGHLIENKRLTFAQYCTYTIYEHFIWLKCSLWDHLLSVPISFHIWLATSLHIWGGTKAEHVIIKLSSAFTKSLSVCALKQCSAEGFLSSALSPFAILLETYNPVMV